MGKFYFDPEREDDPRAIPDAETFYQDENETPAYFEDGERMPQGWYWWPCFPGCLPDGEPVGPFDSEEGAIADAQGKSS